MIEQGGTATALGQRRWERRELDGHVGMRRDGILLAHAGPLARVWTSPTCWVSATTREKEGKVKFSQPDSNFALGILRKFWNEDVSVG